MLRAVLLAVLIACPAARAEGPPAALTAKLRKGVNVSHWWWSASRDEKPEKAVTIDDARLIKNAGITHVRIPVDPALFVNADGKLEDAAAARLLKSVKLFNDAGLAVVIDAHPAGGSARSKQMLPADNPTGWLDEMDRFWKAFAPVWKQTNPDTVAVELLNEPNGLDDPKAWPAAQERLRATVRAALPRHAIILTGDDWGSIDGLTHLEPANPKADTNVIYSIHFYEPHTFTHQGATWGSPMWKEIKELRYPFDAANAETVAKSITDPKAANSVNWYAKDQWDAAKIRARFDKAKAWAASCSPPATLYLGEFGAYRKGCDDASRKAWLTDVRTAAEANGIGWCVWDYSGGFAITNRNGNAPRSLDEDAARALGLAITKPNTPAPQRAPVRRP